MVSLDPELLSDISTDTDMEDIEITEELAAKVRANNSVAEMSVELLEAAIAKLLPVTTLPFPQTLSITSSHSVVSKIEDHNDDLQREVAFYAATLASATIAKGLCKEHNIHWQRPADYYAEMVKSDSHMNKIRQKMISEKKRIETAQRKRKEREQRKFGKQIQSESIQQKSAEKKQNIESVDQFRGRVVKPAPGKKRKSSNFDDSKPKKKVNNRPGKKSRHDMRLKGKQV
ncbi:hypothetical protein RCL1_000501 [Eukaryota sp. TZLM3-RCL]